MKITKEVISKLNPCKDRFDNYLKFYGLKSSHTKAQFLGLKNITHEDKLWVAFRLMPKKNIALAAADIAELVLPIFEAKYPNDKRPSLAIEAARSGDKAKAAEASNDAYDAAYSVSKSIHAYAAAYAACAAAYATDATDATDAAAYAACAAAYNAYNAAVYASSAFYDYSIYDACRASRNASYASGTNITLQKKIRTIVLKYWK